MKKTLKVLAFSALAAAAVCAAACNTVEGFGKDMEKGGEKLQEKAN